MRKARHFTPFEDEVITTIGLKYTDKVISKVLRRSEKIINSRRLALGFRKRDMYDPSPKLIPLHRTTTAQGHPSNYWKDESELWFSFNPKYYAKDLVGEELNILNKLKKIEYGSNGEIREIKKSSINEATNVS